jgi:hypothetical protein
LPPLSPPPVPPTNVEEGESGSKKREKMLKWELKLKKRKMSTARLQRQTETK